MTPSHSERIFEASVSESSEKSRAINVMRGSWTSVLNGEREVTMKRLHSEDEVFETRYSRMAEPVIPLPPVMKATFPMLTTSKDEESAGDFPFGSFGILPRF